MIRFRLGALGPAVDRRVARIREERVVARMQAADPTVWTSDPSAAEIGDRLGWWALPQRMRPHLDSLRALGSAVRADADRVVLCGMGGSSLAPEVLWRAFGRRDGYPELVLLDSTHPLAVRAAGSAADRSVFVIASKSGTTIETRSFQRYFWQVTGGDGSRFIAITDPGTALAGEAEAGGYRRVFTNPPDVGGRFSALSLFGLVPAALIGIDPGRLLDAAAATALDDYVRLGATLGEAARAGRDKLSLATGASLGALGLWLEQLLAESTGKDEKGVLPVVESDVSGDALAHGDRLLTWIGHEGSASPFDRAAADGHPIVELTIGDSYELGAAFFGWEVATAVAAHVLGVHPFNQPNVAESKTLTARALQEDRVPARAVVSAGVGRWLDELPSVSYVAVTAYVPPDVATDARMEAIQRALRARTGVAVTIGYGPRYLHSTGQYHKGGPPNGAFIQVLGSDDVQLAIPGAPYGFADLIAAQAEGDQQALAARGRPVLCVRGWDDLEQELTV